MKPHVILCWERNPRAEGKCSVDVQKLCCVRCNALMVKGGVNHIKEKFRPSPVPHFLTFTFCLRREENLHMKWWQNLPEALNIPGALAHYRWLLAARGWVWLVSSKPPFRLYLKLNISGKKRKKKKVIFKNWGGDGECKRHTCALLACAEGAAQMHEWHQGHGRTVHSNCGDLISQMSHKGSSLGP